MNLLVFGSDSHFSLFAIVNCELFDGLARRTAECEHVANHWREDYFWLDVAGMMAANICNDPPSVGRSPPVRLPVPPAPT